MTDKTPPLWTAAEAAAATQGHTSADFTALGVSIDTRSLQKGDLFVALKGDHLDGHNYIDAAFAAGASAAMVSKEYDAAQAKGPLLVVDDTMKGLEDLGRAARARCKGKIIGVAGSVGKTGTKEMLATLLSACGKTHASKKSFNNHWGVPLSLSNLPSDADFGVFEIGMNHPGEIIGLTDQVKPHIAVITTIDREHIEFFDNGLDGIADANAEIFTGMTAEGIAILNHDNPYFDRLKAHAEKQGIKTILGFGEDDGADIQLMDCALHADSSRVTADVMGTKARYKLQIPGKHIVLNSLGALGVVKAAGGDLDAAIEALKNAEAVTGRGNRHKITLAAGAPPLIIIDESYNANPASMQAAFRVFEMVAPQGDGRRLAVLGDMLELGKDGPRLHAELANPLLKAKADLLFCCGPLMDALYQALPPDWQGAHAKDSKALTDIVKEAVKPGDVLLVKGSAGSRMAYVIEALHALHVTGSAANDKPTAANTSGKDNQNAL
jgi:UDP-N-acetylmuramoyl-tripeptide--D-alanyl-D-alanine ligase